MATKTSLDRRARRRRLIGAILDPRAWAHLLKLVNYYNYSHVAPLRRVRVGPDAAISPNAAFSHPERIEIGARCRIGARTHLWAGPSVGRIVIGDDALLGPDVLITAAGYRFRDGSPVTAQEMDEADVTIGRDVWIGAKAVLLPGARVGDGAIVAAAAVVRGAVPAFAVVAGAPARVVSWRAPPAAGGTP